MSGQLREMRTEFGSREELLRYVRSEFPAVAATDDQVSETRGGRQAALAVLETIQPDRYGFSRNYLHGAVTRLSMYIRHGVLTLIEVRDRALEKVANPFHAAKFLTELAWREYWQRVYETLGNGIWKDQEAYKTGFAAGDYSTEFPEDLSSGDTGLACMDGFSRELRHSGYLHNHARMWFAAYVVHWRRVRWQAGARWFLQHLLDGDPASNNLSWQWVASTFSHKPYFFNRENLEKYTDGVYCANCSSAGNCPFEASYAELETRLFPKRTASEVEANSLLAGNSRSFHRGRRSRGGHR